MQRAPRRTCVGCRTTRAKPDLVRLVVTPAGVAIDPDHTLPGRGAYVCPNPRCIDRVDRAGGQQLRRALPKADITTTTAALTELRAALDSERGPRRGTHPSEQLETAGGGRGPARPPARQASHDGDTDRSTTT